LPTKWSYRVTPPTHGTTPARATSFIDKLPSKTPHLDANLHLLKLELLKRISALLLVGVLAWNSGLPQGILQTIAWGKMLTSYSNQAGLEEGLRKTFDGQHPCKLCERIAQSRPESTSTHLAVAPIPPADLLWVFETVTARILPSEQPPLFSSLTYLIGANRASPLIPPPRA